MVRPTSGEVGVVPRTRVVRKREDLGGDGHEEEEVVGASLGVADPACWASGLDDGGVCAHVLASKRVGRSTTREVIEISGSPAGCEFLIAHLQHVPTVADFSLTWTAPNRLFGVVEARGCSACHVLQESRAVALETVCRGEGILRWNLACQGRSALEALIADLRARGLLVVVDRIGPAPSVGGMTPRQREVLRTAMNLGYFSEPRRVGLADIAVRFGVSKTAVSRILRKAERNGLSALRP